MPKPPSELPDSQAMPDPARDKRQSRSFTVEEKKRLLAQAEACQDRGELGALLGQETIYSAQLPTWRRPWAAPGEVGLHHAPAGRKPLTEAKDRPIETLQPEKAKLEQRLRLAEGLRELPKKPSRCWNSSTTRNRHDPLVARAWSTRFPSCGLYGARLTAGFTVPLSGTPTAGRANARRATHPCPPPSATSPCPVGSATRESPWRA